MFDPIEFFVSRLVEGSKLKTAAVVKRKLRIRVLDSRSGRPITHCPVEKVLIAKKDEAWDENAHRAARYLGDPDWDITANFIIPVSAQGNPASWKGFGANDRSNLQRAMNALGYDCGRPSKQFGQQGWKAMKSFQEDWYAEHPEEKKPEKFVHKMTLPWIQRIVAAHNKRFIQAIQFHLTALGYPCDSDQGEWGSTTSEAYKKWQRVELGYKKPFSSFNSLKYKKKLQGVAQKLKEAKKSFTTDTNGDLEIPIPAANLRSGFKLLVGFADFAIIAEQSGWRSSPDPGSTGFGIEWVDTQDTETGAWGWRLRPPGNNDTAESLPEFRATFELAVPQAPGHDWKKLSDDDAKGFSPFFKSTSGHPEVVLFALVWCQPVWDEIQDPPAGHLINSQAYVQDPAEKDRNMHIVTMWTGGTAPYMGKGYGFFEWVEEPKYRNKKEGAEKGDHGGIDLHAAGDSNIFAVHGGRVGQRGKDWDEHDPPKSAGKFIFHKWSRGEPGKRKQISYLHLNDHVAADKSWVRAGQVVGLAGRTGNLGEVSIWPGHVHLNVGGDGYEVALRSTPEDPENRACIPHNDLPLLFPCHCEVTHPDPDSNPNGCRFSRTMIADPCWAPAELRCPHLLEPGQTNRRLQAQLRYLHEKVSKEVYSDPGILDGKMGELAKGGEVNLKKDDRLDKLPGQKGDLRKVQAGEVVGWAKREDLGKWIAASREYELEKPLERLLPGLGPEEVGSTRRAIYNFRKANPDKEGNPLLKPGGEENPDNYEMDPKAWEKLDELAPVERPAE